MYDIFVIIVAFFLIISLIRLGILYIRSFKKEVINLDYKQSTQIQGLSYHKFINPYSTKKKE